MDLSAGALPRVALMMPNRGKLSSEGEFERLHETVRTRLCASFTKSSDVAGLRLSCVEACIAWARVFVWLTLTEALLTLIPKQVSELNTSGLPNAVMQLCNYYIALHNCITGSCLTSYCYSLQLLSSAFN